MKETMLYTFAFIVFFFIAHVIGSVSCEMKSSSFDDNKFNILTGCMVKHYDQWLPLDNIRGIDLRPEQGEHHENREGSDTTR